MINQIIEATKGIFICALVLTLALIYLPRPSPIKDKSKIQFEEINGTYEREFPKDWGEIIKSNGIIEMTPDVISHNEIDHWFKKIKLFKEFYRYWDIASPNDKKIMLEFYDYPKNAEQVEIMNQHFLEIEKQINEYLTSLTYAN